MWCFDAADTGHQFRTQQASVCRFVCQAPNGCQSEIDGSLSMKTGASPEVTRDNMGHSTVDVTQNIYTGTWWEQRAEAVRAIGELIWGGG